MLLSTNRGSLREFDNHISQVSLSLFHLAKAISHWFEANKHCPIAAHRRDVQHPVVQHERWLQRVS